MAAVEQKTDKAQKGGDIEAKGITVSAADALTALAGGAQAGTAVSAMISRFTVVAAIGNSAQLPAAQAGLELTIINSGANSMNVFPQTGETINALAANAALAVAVGKTATFVCPVAGKWFALVSA